MNEDESDDGAEIEILLVEDNPGDVRLTIKALKEGKIGNAIHHVPDGVAAMAYLRQEGLYAKARRPDLVLLDLNLPRKDGRAVLKEIKSDPDLHFLPVVILTSSPAEEDVIRSYDLHANCYIVKPVDFEQFMKVVRCIEGFWLKLVRLPARPFAP
jgi:CheY-like chemotaxis protein